MHDQNLDLYLCDDISYFRHVLRATLSGVARVSGVSLQWIKKNAPLQNSKWLLVWAADTWQLDPAPGTFWNKKVYCLICHHLPLKLLYCEASCFYEDIGHEGLKLSLPSNHNFRKLAAVGAENKSPALRSEPWQILIRLRGLPRRRVTCGGNFKARLSSAERASYSSPLAYKEWKNRKVPSQQNWWWWQAVYIRVMSSQNAFNGQTFGQFGWNYCGK